MATTKTIKASGGDYTTLAAWEDAIDGNLTGTGVAEAICYALDDTTAVNIFGWTTTSSDYIYIHTDATARHAGVWNGDKYNLVVAASSGLAIIEEFVQLDGLQIQCVTPSANSQNPLVVSNNVADTAVIHISNCIIRGDSDATYTVYGIYLQDAVATTYIWNCLVYGIAAASNRIGIWVSGTSYVYSTTVIGGASGIYCTGTATLKNCYAGGTSFEDIRYVSGTLAKTNCASEDGSADDTGANETQSNCITGVALDTDTFVNVSAGTEDFHLAADGLSPLQAAGVNTSGDSDPLNFTTDIDGDTISNWSIGADDGVVASGATNLVMNIL